MKIARLEALRIRWDSKAPPTAGSASLQRGQRALCFCLSLRASLSLTFA